MAKSLINKKSDFGTFPVFVTAISTLLGAILFLRFGYAVGHVGFVGVLGIIVIGHLVTIPTALAVAEIATNQRVLGGGAYYIISRSFGLTIGAAIGIALYLSQAISVAFYVIAFVEALEPQILYVQENIWPFFGKKCVSIPVMLILSALILTRGANIGMKALYFVAFILFISLLLFFLGSSPEGTVEFSLNAKIKDSDGFFYVFTIIFPAFTGLAAGLGLSGDLKNPRKSIPLGTITATIVALIIYVGVAYKLVISASIEDLAGDQLIMKKIALWGPIIPIGLGAASLSSAIGSILIAPRTLQAIGVDNIFPKILMNNWLAKGKLGSNEPVNASLVSIIIAFCFVIVGELDIVAEIISMFFMVTYGSICLISLLEHFAADPSYRPTFKSKWYFSFIGAILSIWLMFKMNLSIAILSLFLMSIFYYMVIVYNKDKKGLVKLFRGVVFQLSRGLQILAQRADKEEFQNAWRPFAICISHDSFKRRSAFDLLRWISFKYGFGTYIHYIKGFLNQETNRESKDVLKRLINLASGSKNRVYLDTIISPSYTSAVAQVIQLSGISGKGNNMILFEFSRTEPEALVESLNTYSLLQSAEFDVCILNTSYKGFGYKKEIHIWITSQDFENANMMILLGYIILGHPEWSKGYIKIFALYNEAELEQRKRSLLSVIKSGRLPISPSNVELISTNLAKSVKQTICEHSLDADLTIVGFNQDRIATEGTDIFTGYGDIGNVLFVSSCHQKEIK